MKHVIWVMWPAFIAAGIAEVIFFTMIDPRQLYLFGQQVEWSAIATYSTGFLLFWLVCIGSSLMTYFMMPHGVKTVLIKAVSERHNPVRPSSRREPSATLPSD